MRASKLYETISHAWFVFQVLVQDHLPRGGAHGKYGHVLITSRRVSDQWRGRRCVHVACFNSAESIAFLRKAAAGDNDSGARTFLLHM